MLNLSPEERAMFMLDEPVLGEFFMEGRLGATIESLSDIRILERILRPADESALEELG